MHILKLFAEVFKKAEPVVYVNNLEEALLMENKQLKKRICNSERELLRRTNLLYKTKSSLIKSDIARCELVDTNKMLTCIDGDSLIIDIQELVGAANQLSQYLDKFKECE